MLAQNIVFGVIALAMGLAALRVVTTRNVVHAALYLVVVLGGVAGLYILLAGEFVAVVQVLVYIGAILVLFLFGVMLTRAPIGRASDLDNDQKWLAAIVSASLFAVLATALLRAFDDRKFEKMVIFTSSDVGISIFRTYVLPFEVISVLLLAALIGAVVLARRD